MDKVIEVKEGYITCKKLCNLVIFLHKIPSSKHRATTLTYAPMYHNIGWHMPSIKKGVAPFKVRPMY